MEGGGEGKVQNFRQDCKTEKAPRKRKIALDMSQKLSKAQANVFPRQCAFWDINQPLGLRKVHAPDRLVSHMAIKRTSGKPRGHNYASQSLIFSQRPLVANCMLTVSFTARNGPPYCTKSAICKPFFVSTNASLVFINRLCFCNANARL